MKISQLTHIRTYTPSFSSPRTNITFTAKYRANPTATYHPGESFGTYGFTAPATIPWRTYATRALRPRARKTAELSRYLAPGRSHRMRNRPNTATDQPAPKVW